MLNSFLSIFVGQASAASESPSEFAAGPDQSNFLEKMKAEKKCGVCADPETLSQMKSLLDNSNGSYRLPEKRKLLRPKTYSKDKFLYSSPEITPTGYHLGNFTDYRSVRVSRRWILNRELNAPKEHVPYILRYSQRELQEISDHVNQPEMEEFEVDYHIPSDPIQRERELGTKTENDVSIILHPDGSISPLHCPTSYEQLSQGTWTYLHTMAAYYPENPTPEFKQSTRVFMDHFAHLYPCQHCKDHMIIYLKENPVTLDNNRDFSTWMCNYHNQVNAFLGKRLIQCDPDYLVHRYKDGYPVESGVKCPNV